MHLGPAHWNEPARDYKLRRTSEILRGPLEWSLDLTSSCPGACQHCFNRSGRLPREELDNSQVLDVAHQIAAMGPMGLCLCGGEPMLRLDLACQVVRIITDANGAVNMVTSGHGVTAHSARALKQAGIDVVQVSVDGAQAETHDRLRQRPGSFDQAILALELLRAAEITTSLAFSPARFNIHEFEQVVALGQRLEAQDVRVQPIMPLGEGLLNWHRLAPSTEQYRELVATYKRFALCDDGGIKVQWGDPVDHLVRFGQFYSLATQNVHITSDGYLTPSVYLPLYLGNVRQAKLEEYWRAGVSRAWDLRLVRELAFQVRSMHDMACVVPVPFFDPPVLLDLVSDSPERIEQVTDAVLGLAASVARRRAQGCAIQLWYER